MPDDFVAGLNGRMIGAALRQVYARDMNFRYQLPSNEEARKASKLIDDQRFLRSKKDNTGEAKNGREPIRKRSLRLLRMCEKTALRNSNSPTMMG